MSINLNLLPWREERKELQKREFLFLLALGVMVAVGIMFCVHGIFNRQINFQNDNNKYLQNEIAKLDLKIAEIQGLQKEKQQLLARMDIIQQLQTNRPQIVRLFDGIVHMVPEGLYLTNLTRTGARVLIDGKAESNTRVSTFMRNIESSNLLKNPILSLIQADEKSADKSAPKTPERMIGFNLLAIQTVDEQANLNKLVKEDKGAPEPKTLGPKKP
jgi:type IV pilus assembly protein PilN